MYCEAAQSYFLSGTSANQTVKRDFQLRKKIKLHEVRFPSYGEYCTCIILYFTKSISTNNQLWFHLKIYLLTRLRNNIDINPLYDVFSCACVFTLFKIF